MIKKIEIDGYRLLRDFRADLGRLTVVIGANATGKSSLLECLEMLNDAVRYPIAKAFGYYGGITSIANAGQEDLGLTIKVIFDGHVYELTVKSDSDGAPWPVREVLSQAHPRKGKKKESVLLESSPKGSWVYSEKDNQMITFEDTEAKDKDERYLLLAQMRFTKDFSEAAAVRQSLSKFRVYPCFDVARNSLLRSEPSEIKPVALLSASGHNLGTVLHELMTRYKYRASAEEILDFTRSAYPSIESIQVETTSSKPPKVWLRLQEKNLNRLIDVFEMSDGMLRFLCMAAALLSPSPPPLIALDEPETGLHPRLLPIVADMIKTAAERTQVLITTHSPDLLNYFDLDDIAVMTRGPENIFWNRPSTRRSLRTMLSEVRGETLGDLHRSGELESIS